MGRSKKQIAKKFQNEPQYLAVVEAAYELRISESAASKFFDEAAADGVTLLQFARSKRVSRKEFWAWVLKNKFQSVTFS